MYEDLSGIQIEILEFIKDELNTRGYPHPFVKYVPLSDFRPLRPFIIS
jgi:hypothetical protein